MNDVRFGSNLNQQQLAQLQQQQYDQQLQQMQQMQMQQQMTTEQQKPNRRRIRKQNKAAAAAAAAGVDGDEIGEEKTEKRPAKKKHIDDNVSIEEALKALTLTPEGACSAMKTPVSVLQELLSRRGITPTYDLVQIEGAIHEPTFRYRVTYGNKDGKSDWGKELFELRT